MRQEIMLAYPDYTQPFEVYTDERLIHLGTFVVQNVWPITSYQKAVINPKKVFCN